MLNELIGAVLIAVYENGFSVILLSGEKRTYKLNTNEGDCSGYNDFYTTLFADEPSLITCIETNRIINSKEDRLVITFFKLDKEIAEIESASSSCSSQKYGASVILKCEETNQETLLTSW